MQLTDDFVGAILSWVQYSCFLALSPSLPCFLGETHDDDALSDEESPKDSEDGECLHDHHIPDKYKDRVSVLLPLPVVPGTKTTFPVIVNAFFAVSENRRSIKFEAEDDHSDEVNNDHS